jgi:hypothetical protein
MKYKDQQERTILDGTNKTRGRAIGVYQDDRTKADEVFKQPTKPQTADQHLQHAYTMHPVGLIEPSPLADLLAAAMT